MTAPPQPIPDNDTQPYWDALARGELRLQRCIECRRFQHFPAPVCFSCSSLDLSFEPVSGHGEVESFVVIAHVTSPAFAADAPYAMAWVELAEQPQLRVLANIIDCPVDQVHIGLAVSFVADTSEPGGAALLRFRPRQKD